MTEIKRKRKKSPALKRKKPAFMPITYYKICKKYFKLLIQHLREGCAAGLKVVPQKDIDYFIAEGKFDSKECKVIEDMHYVDQMLEFTIRMGTHFMLEDLMDEMLTKAKDLGLTAKDLDQDDHKLFLALLDIMEEAPISYVVSRGIKALEEDEDTLS